jgi:hypothetical protein
MTSAGPVPTPVAPPDEATKWLLRAGFAGPLLFVGGFLLLGATRPHYKPRYTFASQLGLNGGGRVWRTVNCLAGLLIMAFGVGLHRKVRTGVASSSGWISVVAAGLGFVAFAVSHDDPWLLYPPGAPAGLDKPVSPSGVRHQIGALIAGSGLFVSHLVYARRFAVDGDGRRYWYSVGTAVAFPVLYVAAVASGFASGRPGDPLGGNAGLLQKAAMTTSLAWVAWLARQLLASPPPEAIS